MDSVVQDRELEAKHRALWALGDYQAIADRLGAPLGPTLVAQTGIGSGDRAVDVGAGRGSGASARPGGGARGGGRGVELDGQEANAEALPFQDGSFGAVLSCIGVMFAPHHQQAADELLRVCRPGGAVGLLSWTPTGFIGKLFATMKPYVAAPVAGVSSPPLWGSEDHV